MTIYFIQCGDGGPIKIGYTKNSNSSLKKRLSTLQLANPVQLTVLCLLDGDEEYETLLHNKYAAYNIRGEWFSQEGELDELIKTQPYIGLRSEILKGENHQDWKGAEATEYSKRGRVQRRIKLRNCDECGNPGRCRVAKDGNLDNLDVENYNVYCMSCTMTNDGRKEKLAQTARGRKGYRKEFKQCKICTEPRWRLRKGRCHPCNEYFRRHGKERSVLLHAVKVTNCQKCNRSNAKLTKKLCPKCYQATRRANDKKM